MKIKFFGGASEVGRSMLVLEKEEKNICLDCGIKLGEKIEFPTAENSEIPENIIISHAHLDHCGFLAHLKNKKIICTKPTKDLIPVIISDYARLSGIKFEVNPLVQNATAMELHEKRNINGFQVELFNAGHILGSSITKIGEILYTGDFNIRGSRILDPAEMPDAKTLLIESTYGGKDDTIPSMKDELSRLCSIINETISKNGVVLLPSFAIGRAQEVLVALDSLMRSGRIKKVPIYVDGMIRKAMQIYRMNVIFARKDIQNQILMSLHDPFRSNLFKTSKSIDKKDVKAPCIVVTTSGMLKGGPIMKYLKNFAGDENSTMIFLGYQAEGTPGREILDGKKSIILDEEEIELKLRIEKVKLSGHCDRNDLIKFISTVKPEKVILVHGERKKQEELADSLPKKYNVEIPKVNDVLEI